MVFLKSVAKEVAVRAVYFPDSHLKNFNSLYNVKVSKNNAYTKNIKDVVIFEKFEKVLRWCLNNKLYKAKRS